MNDFFLFSPPPEPTPAPAVPPSAASFARTHSRSSDPGTSRRAAEKVSFYAESQCGKIYEILKEGPIEGDAFYSRALAVGVKNPRARVSDLRKWGKAMGFQIEVDDEGVYRLTHNNQEQPQ